MVLTNMVSCEVCGKEYWTRYSLGNMFPQQVSYFCQVCENQITIRLEDTIQEMKFTGAKHLPGKYYNGQPEIKVITLHPEIPVSKQSQDDPTYFPSFDFFHAMNNNRNGPPVKFDFSKAKSQWDKIEIPFKLACAKKDEILSQKYRFSREDVFEEVEKIAIFFLDGAWVKFQNRACDLIDDSEDKLDELLVWYNLNEYHNLLDSSYLIFKQYFSLSDDLSATVLYQKNGILINDAMKCSTSNWDKIKMFYGQVYEQYGSRVVLLTCLNNIFSGRKFDVFQTANFTLENYLKTDKFGRCANFSGNTYLEEMSKFYDNDIRNGTHHYSCSFDHATSMINLYVGKDGKTHKQLSYLKYIETCNELFARYLALLNVGRYLVNLRKR